MNAKLEKAVQKIINDNLVNYSFAGLEADRIRMKDEIVKLIDLFGNELIDYLKFNYALDPYYGFMPMEDRESYADSRDIIYDCIRDSEKL